jgi:outer membrane receptor protein involved in Fe transport
MGTAVVATAICLTIVGLSMAQEAGASVRRATNIPPQSLSNALENLARQRGLALAYRSEIVGGLKSAGATGELTTDEAFHQILSGTGLTYRYLDDKTVTIVPVARKDGTSSTRAHVEGEGGAGVSDPREQEGIWDRLLVAQATLGSNSTSPSVMAAATSSPKSDRGEVNLQEVVVTARKTEERLLDVPMPVTALDTASLVQSNNLRIEDYYMQVPSLNFAEAVQSGQTLFIRGLGTSMLLDEAPLTGPTPDIDPGNLQRIEVLRGPQGTLYGANGMGGVVKFVTIDPSPDALTARVQVGTEGVHNGYDLGYNARGLVNVPLSNDLAVRISGFARQDPGYLDNPVLDIDGINRAEAYGGLLTALWRPSDSFSLRLSALYQDIHGGNNDATPTAPQSFIGPALIPFGDLQQVYIKGVGPYDQKTEGYSAVVKAKLGAIDLTSVTAYSANSTHDYTDATTYSGFGQAAEAQFGPPYSGVALYTVQAPRQYTQEIRLSGSVAQRLDVLLGFYYTHISPDLRIYLPASDPLTGAVGGQLGFFEIPSSYTEYATFLTLTYHVTDRIDVQVGGRASRLSQYFYTTVSGEAFGCSAPCVAPTTHADPKPNTYLFTPSFKISPGWMVYVRLASGFTPGGVNTPGVGPPQFGPEKTKNYEIGTKWAALSGKLSFDASLYRIDHTDIQQEVYSPANGGQSYTANVGAAVSQGVELTMQARPTSHLSIAAWVVYTDARLTDVPEEAILAQTSGGGPQVTHVGDQVPFTSPWSANADIQQEFSLTSSLTGFVGANASYLGERLGPYAPAGERQVFPAFTKADLRAGLTSGPWAVNLYCNNVADRRGVVSGDGQLFIPYSRYYIRPRTIGVNVSRSF